MEIKRNEFILLGLEKYKEIIDNIVTDLNAFNHYFDIRLILTEALTNVFKYGNKNRIDKPIYLRYIYNGTKVKFELESSENILKNVTIPDKLSDDDLLKENGRGLFLMKCFADKINLKDNILIIEKSLTEEFNLKMEDKNESKSKN
ncbi:ATP-binding protein [Clostridium ganghwense]|uniref:ATP-binding protein n=1 Tax=Clostridium ganghwense TaxID=312089 RepID=A0ABT4CP37_9CLOT|nr:ATP-binding protein [Clostridium ganghwense]MCY6370822.1 ATP-binding protein [Clostridium ganghwense]